MSSRRRASVMGGMILVLSLGVVGCPDGSLEQGPVGTPYFPGQDMGGLADMARDQGVADQGVPDSGTGGGEDQGEAADQGVSEDQGEDLGGEDMAPDMAPVDMSPADMAPADMGPQRVGAFVAQGHVGRRVLSCDGGASWVDDVSYDTTHKCYADMYTLCNSGDQLTACDCDATPDMCSSKQLDCDHGAGAGRGIIEGNGWFMATFGWGPPGDIVRSQDGVSWEVVHSNATFGGLAFVDDVFVAGARQVKRSTDDGVTWSERIETTLDGYNVRRVGGGQLATLGSRVILVGEGGDFTLSSDAGATWWDPDMVPAECGASIQTDGGIAFLKDTILVLGGNGLACTSTDGGKTWSSAQAADRIASQLVVHDGVFKAWVRGTLYQSADGVTWSSMPITPSEVEPGAVAVSDTGEIAAARGGWQTWYEKQRFYHSKDGITWTIVDSADYTGGHPIRAMAFGRISPSTQGCAAP